MKRIALLVICFVLWMLLAWPFESAPGETVRVQTEGLIAGLGVALLVGFVMRDVTPREFRLWVNPVRYFWMVIYVVVLAYYIVKANFDVAYRVLHPEMPIRPGIVRVKTGLKSVAAITVLANSITLTPGTLTVNAAENGTLYVHWINVRSSDVDVATKHIVQRFEWFLKRIFE